MAQSTVALFCVGSLLAWDNAVVIPCDHPASPLARSAPPIVVPPIQTLGIEGVTPDLAEEGAKQHEHKPSAAKGGKAEREHKPSTTKGGAAQHQHQPSSTKAGAAQHHRPPSSTNGGAQQHQH
jgi:hypothetical protein